MELHDMAQGLLALCRTSVKADFFCEEGLGAVMVFSSAIKEMLRIIVEIDPEESGEGVIREVGGKGGAR